MLDTEKIEKSAEKSGKSSKKKSRADAGQKKSGAPMRRDFMDEVLDRIVALKLDGESEFIAGKVVDDTPYWLKLVDANGKIIYINKAFIKILIPR